MYLFFFLVHNNYMKRVIIDFIKIFKIINLKFNIAVLASANTFYMILIVIPLNKVGLDFTDVNIADFLDIYKWGLIFLVNLILVGTRYLNTLKVTCDEIYGITNKKPVERYFKTLLVMIILVLIVTTLIIISFGAIKIWYVIINGKYYFMIKFLEFLLTTTIMTIVVGLIFKYLIVQQCQNIKIFKISVFLSLTWLILSTLYQNVNNFMFLKNIKEEYNEILSIYIIYTVNYIVMSIVIYNYWKTKNELFLKKGEII